MTRLAQIEAHLQSMHELRDIVGAMRSLAGMRVQEAQGMLPGIRLYAQAIESALADTLLLMKEPEPPRRADRGGRVLVVYTAEHGFVGAFNEHLLEAAEAGLGAEAVLFVLGSRGAVLASERGRPAGWAHAMASRSSGAVETVERLSRELYLRIARGEVAAVEVLYSRYRQGRPATLERRQLLPLDPASLAVAQLRQKPLHNLDAVELHEKLMVEFVFALLTEAAVESIASENAARLAAMESAHENLSHRLDRLQQDSRQARQSEITAEILELVTAAKAQDDGPF